MHGDHFDGVLRHARGAHVHEPPKCHAEGLDERALARDVAADQEGLHAFGPLVGMD